MRNINKAVLVEVNHKTALICLDNPPVNAASQTLRDGVQKALIWASSQNDIGVIAIYSAGRTFVAGADIKEFGKQPLAPFLPDLVNEILLSDSKSNNQALFRQVSLGGHKNDPDWGFFLLFWCFFCTKNAFCEILRGCHFSFWFG